MVPVVKARVHRSTRTLVGQLVPPSPKAIPLLLDLDEPNVKILEWENFTPNNTT